MSFFQSLGGIVTSFLGYQNDTNQSNQDVDMKAEEREKEKINILLVTTHGNYFIRPGENGTVLHNKKIAPINFNMINAAPLGVCNIVTDVSVQNVVTNITDHGNQLYINSEIEQETTGESLDEVFKRNLNNLLRNRIDKAEHKNYDYTYEGQIEDYKKFGQYFTSRYRDMKKTMQGEEYENKSFSFDLKERNGKDKTDMTITLFTIDDTNIESHDLSTLFGRATRHSGTKTTLEKLLFKCEEMGLDDVIVLDLTCSVVHPGMSGRKERAAKRDFIQATRGGKKTQKKNGKKRRKSSYNRKGKAKSNSKR